MAVIRTEHPQIDYNLELFRVYDKNQVKVLKLFSAILNIIKI